MLIDSPRITPADRAIWDELLEQDKIYARSNGYKRHLQITESILSDFITASKESGKRYYVGLSWGKDSVCLADMMHRLGAKCKYVYIRNLAREPEGNISVRDAFLETHDIDYEEIAYDYSHADRTYFDRNGKPKKWQHILAELKEKYGCHVTGIRYDESAKRKRRFRTMGLETEYSFAPFRYFDVYDVFAYLYERDLPVHPNYAMLGGGRWDKYLRRVTAIGNPEGDGIGRTEWEKEYYADILNRLK